jgi:hypothetical protein
MCMTRRKQICLIGIFFIIAIATRLLPHEANMTAIGALALAAGTLLPRRFAMIVPLAALLVSDAFIGGYEISVMIAVYGSMAGIALIGNAFRASGIGTRILGGAFASATFFFLVTNFAVWVTTPWYEKSVAGLTMAYALAIPFWRNMLFGDLVYGAIFMGAIAFFAAYQKQTQEKTLWTMNWQN